MQKIYFKKQIKVFIVIKSLVFMMIVFNTGISGKLYSQEMNSEEVKAHMDSVRAKHLERVQLLRKEMLDKHYSQKHLVQSTNNSENTLVINGKLYTSKDSIEIASQDGLHVKSYGKGNNVIVNTNEIESSVIVNQTGNGNKATVSQNNNKPKTTKKENL
ncbi:hypothetical protein MM213_14265 [Belliella sp. R4-6]|uniref:Uncharacterized protein n=1 Tax=Belliella alkalica TaxID=1730871 RepID=A0ABS9VE09_9BACT|nr:hypothetical protein [Belliella alkalica]MCH7414661.1 hypothetical protein [Belliella alkalica]